MSGGKLWGWFDTKLLVDCSCYMLDKVINVKISLISSYATAGMASGGSSYPFMESEAGELTVGDVEILLSSYKDVVRKYTGLCRTVQHFSMSKMDTAILHLEGTDVSRRPEEQTEVEQRCGD